MTAGACPQSVRSVAAWCAPYAQPAVRHCQLMFDETGLLSCSLHTVAAQPASAGTSGKGCTFVTVNSPQSSAFTPMPSFAAPCPAIPLLRPAVVCRLQHLTCWVATTPCCMVCLTLSMRAMMLRTWRTACPTARILTSGQTHPSWCAPTAQLHTRCVARRSCRVAVRGAGTLGLLHKGVVSEGHQAAIRLHWVPPAQDQASYATIHSMIWSERRRILLHHRSPHGCVVTWLCRHKE